MVTPWTFTMTSRRARPYPPRSCSRRAESAPDGLRTAPGHIRQIAAGRYLRDVITRVPRVLLPITLAKPGPSGSAGPFRLCQGCSHPHPAPSRGGRPQLHRPATTGSAVVVSRLPSNISASWRTDAGIKLDSVASDVMGKSARAMLEALIAGERDPATLARGRLRVQIGALTEALAGRFAEHHAFLARMILAHIDAISAMLTELDTRIDEELAPYRSQVELLDSIDGIDIRTAQVIIAEIGVEMARFPTAAHLASWAGVCPGNNKTAGKAKTAATRPGNRWLKAALGTAALGALRKKSSYLHALYRRIAARRGGKRALAAVAHSQLVTIWHVLSTQTPYRDLGGDCFLRRDNPEHRRRRALDQLERLGYRVILEPAA